MRVAFVLSALAGLASAETHPAWRLVPMAEIGYGYDGVAIENSWTDGAGLNASVGGQGTFYLPKEDSMGWALGTELRGSMLSGDLDGALTVPDGTPSGSSFSQTSFSGRVQTGPFYRMFGLWGNSGGIFGIDYKTTEGDLKWEREDYALVFGLYTEIGADPWVREGVRVGLSAARIGGEQTWTKIFDEVDEAVVSDSSEWLTEGFEVRAGIEYWSGPAWARLGGQMTSVDLRHRSGGEGSQGESMSWTIGLTLGYRFACGNLAGFR